MEVILEILRQTGLAGLAVIAVVFALRKDRRNEALHERLEAKSERYARKYYKLANELNMTVGALVDELGLDPSLASVGDSDDQE